jgi:hypothetical protein
MTVLLTVMVALVAVPSFHVNHDVSFLRAGMIGYVELDDAAPILASLPHPVVHLKGFTHGLLWPAAPDPPALASFGTDELRRLCARAASATLSQLQALNPATLVWDGDGLSPGSFTALIPMLARQRPQMRLISFKYAHQRQLFEDDWSGAHLPVTVILVPRPACLGVGEEPDYARLGFEAIRDTRSELCVCVGGGPVVADEFRLSRQLVPPPRFIFVDVPRWTAHPEPGVAMEHSALMGLVQAEPLS